MIQIDLTKVSKLEEALNTKTEQELKDLRKMTDIDLKTQFKFLDLNALSFASQLISLDLSQFLYNKLRAYESTTLAERVIILQVMQELIKKLGVQIK